MYVEKEMLFGARQEVDVEIPRKPRPCLAPGTESLGLRSSTAELFLEPPSHEQSTFTIRETARAYDSPVARCILQHGCSCAFHDSQG